MIIRIMMIMWIIVVKMIMIIRIIIRIIMTTLTKAGAVVWGVEQKVYKKKLSFWQGTGVFLGKENEDDHDDDGGGGR